ncbi:MAG: CAP domain-containing protein [Oscillospiraceae bacterium]|nr:CAP domain-containing protein [Oscillospiraceae bacterium]
MKLRNKEMAAVVLLFSLIIGCLVGCGENEPAIDSSETITGYYVDEESGKIIDAETGEETKDETLAVDTETGNIVNTETGETVQTKEETNAVTEKVTSEINPPVTNHTHSYVSETVAPTCTEKGYTKLTCKCGDVKKENYTEALGHSYGDFITIDEANCSKTGVQERKCSRCGKTERKDIAKTEHTFSEWRVTKQPTTTAEGERARTCSYCGYSEKQSVAKLTYTPHTITAAEQKMLNLINQARAENSLNALSFNYYAYDFAVIRVNESAVSFSHTRPNGKDCVTVLEGSGVVYNVFAENLGAVGPEDKIDLDTVGEIHEALMNSPDHRANILSAKVTSVAIAFCIGPYGLYVAELFFG